MKTTPATRRAWLVAGSVVLIAGHGVILSYVSRHLRLSVWLVGGLITLVVLQHVGLFGVLLASLRAKVQRTRSKPPADGTARATSEGSG
jgi:hypothetical protein